MAFACKYKHEFIKHSAAFKIAQSTFLEILGFFHLFGYYSVGIMFSTEETPETWNIDGLNIG